MFKGKISGKLEKEELYNSYTWLSTKHEVSSCAEHCTKCRKRQSTCPFWKQRTWELKRETSLKRHQKRTTHCLEGYLVLSKMSIETFGSHQKVPEIWPCQNGPPLRKHPSVQTAHTIYFYFWFTRLVNCKLSCFTGPMTVLWLYGQW